MKSRFSSLIFARQQVRFLLLGIAALAFMPSSAEASCGDYLYKRGESKNATAEGYMEMENHSDGECDEHQPQPLQAPTTNIRLHSSDELVSRMIGLRPAPKANGWDRSVCDSPARDGFRSQVDRPPQS